MMKAKWVTLMIGMAAAVLMGCGAKNGGDTAKGSGQTSTEAVTLRLKLKKGDKWSETVSGDVKMDLTNYKPLPTATEQEKKMIEGAKNDTAHFDISYDFETRESSADEVVLKRSATDVKTSGTGMLGDMVKLLEMQKGSSKDVKRSARNTEVEIDTETPVPAIEFPENAVKPGDTWDGTVTYAGAKGKATFKFESMEEIGGKSCAKITFKPSMTEGKKVTVNDPMTVWIDTATGRTVKGTMICGFADGPDGVLMNITFQFQQK